MTVGQSCREVGVALVVDDCEITRRIHRRMLEALGFRVGEGVHGLDALWQVAAMRPRLLLIDLDMPEMDGVLATRALVGMPEPYGGLVIVAVSSAGPDRCRQALEAGAAAVLRKPLDVQALQVHLAHAPTDTVAEPV